jgi:hypothetical protein
MTTTVVSIMSTLLYMGLMSRPTLHLIMNGAGQQQKTELVPDQSEIRNQR